LAIGGVSALHRSSAYSGNGVFQTMSSRLHDILQVGLVDHVQCALLLQRWKQFVPFDEMKTDIGHQALGPDFIALVPMVETKLGPDYKLIQGHRCTVGNREYIHFILTANSNQSILSIVITQKINESLARAGAIAVMTADGIPIYREREGALEVAGFESTKYLAFLVSNLNRESNLNIAAQVAPVIVDRLRHLET
jgi:hypothetical protein